MYNWEGNIRELKNYIEFLGFTEEKIIEFEDMPLAIREYYEEEKNRDRMEREQGREEYCKEIFGKRYEGIYFY